MTSWPCFRGYLPLKYFSVSKTILLVGSFAKRNYLGKVELCDQTIADFPPIVGLILCQIFLICVLLGEQIHTTKVWREGASLLLANECFLETNRSSVSFQCGEACELSTSLLFKMPQETNFTVQRAVMWPKHHFTTHLLISRVNVWEVSWMHFIRTQVWGFMLKTFWECFRYVAWRLEENFGSRCRSLAVFPLRWLAWLVRVSPTRANEPFFCVCGV